MAVHQTACIRNLEKTLLIRQRIGGGRKKKPLRFERARSLGCQHQSYRAERSVIILGYTTLV